MTSERHQHILQSAEELEAAGQVATNSAVFAHVHGHRGDVVQVMKQRRAERAAAGGVAVAEAEDEEPEDEMAEPSAVVIAKDLAALKVAHEGYHAALEKLWALEAEGVWDENISNRETFLEKTLVKNQRERERLEPLLVLALLRDTALRGRDRHDAALPAVRTKAEAVLVGLAALQGCLRSLATEVGDQVDGLVVVRDLRNHQAFSNLVDGKEEVVRLVNAFFPGDSRAKDLVELLMSTDLSKEVRWAEALAAWPRLKPFSESTLRQYLNTLTEGTTNGQHN